MDDLKLDFRSEKIELYKRNVWHKRENCARDFKGVKEKITGNADVLTKNGT